MVTPSSFDLFLSARRSAFAINRVRLLPEQATNQIAAGDLIDRPASMVKDGFKNSLDVEVACITVKGSSRRYSRAGPI